MTLRERAEGGRADPGGRESAVLNAFYRTSRAGQIGLSDGGGPFGFDVHLALLVDQLMHVYGCDAVVETGCYVGDTTDYLTRMYPATPVWSCDLYRDSARFTAARLSDRDQVQIECCDGADLVGRACTQFDLPLMFLDAHGVVGDWPLVRELEAVRRGIVIIHDFDIGHPRFSFDIYDGLTCGPDLLATVEGLPQQYFVPDSTAPWPLPCLQTGRRAGYAILAVGVDPAELRAEPHLRALPIPIGVSA